MVKIRDSDIRVLRNMDVRCSIFKLLLFLMSVTWCSGANIDGVRVQFRGASGVQDEVQDSIRNIIHNGIYSQKYLDVSQTQVVRPLKVTREGIFLSHQLEHEHGHGHPRARRDLHLKDHELDHMLHYNLTVDGHQLRLDLRPSVTFITPAMVVERHLPDSRTRHKPELGATACHYTGSVRDQPHSSVAISACDGLAGLLRTQHGEYWIEPSDQLPEDASAGRPHVVYRRSAVDKVEALHRAKRSVEKYTPHNRNNNDRRQHSRNINSKRNRDNNEMIDRRRREYLEARRKLYRNNPAEYRRQQIRLRQLNEQRRLQANSSHSNSHSQSLETSKSFEINKRKKTKGRGEKIRNKLRKHRRRKRKNCATKQPPYPLENTLQGNENERLHRANNKSRRWPHHHQLSHRAEFPASPETRRRPARSVSKPRHVEVLLVADKPMTDFHKNKTEMYLLTIMNMVSSLYMDPSIGNYIKVVVVKIILLDDQHNSSSKLNVSTNADSTLESFCKWQHQFNPNDDANPHHHDVAILVTRQNICSLKDISCSTLGVAYVAGMCKPDRSCSVNEDNGLLVAHTITHELGHNFGLYHDTEKIGCERREGSTMHIMTPIFEVDTAQVAWSKCSKRDVTIFLDAGAGECLGDTPSQDYEYPATLAGVTYDMTAQCHLNFGPGALDCTNPLEICQSLWCYVNNTCMSILRPPAPGTSCGQDMWCQNKECVPREPTPRPQDGGWGEWGEWSECSRTCGAGVSTQTRDCNNPEPENKGKFCLGERSRYKICNTEECPMGEPNFRDVQCRKYGNNDNEVWQSYFDQDNPCELMCAASNRSPADIAGFVTDGTPCRQTDGARDMCIAGVCHKVGCDWVVDSEKEKDACGVCGGNGTACDTVQGVYDKGTAKQAGFSEVAVIPAGSRNVKIEEKVNRGNFISIRSAKTKKLYMNGVQNQILTQYVVAGSPAVYERDRDWEKVRIPGPITEDLRVYQHIYRGKNRNPMVTYKYTVDRMRNTRYTFSDWSPCSVTCDVGVLKRHLQCVDEHDRLVSLSQCDHIEPPSNNVVIQKCYRPACQHTHPHTHTHTQSHTHWWVGSWNTCSRTCRMPGEESIKHRHVYCVDKILNTITNDSNCDEAAKPMSSIICADIPPC